MSSSLLALARANVRYWPAVAPVVRRQLALCELRAQQIDHPSRRLLALRKLREERFNPQLAATLATLAPHARRREVSEAIVALQVAYDYLDALGEQSHDSSEDPYVKDLLATVKERAAALPAAEAVLQTSRDAAERCRAAQERAHRARGPGDGQLRAWAVAQAQSTPLGWVEWLAGAQASVLSLHALIAASADPATTVADAQALDRAYLRIGALTMLDSLIDRDEDVAAGALRYAQLYASAEEMGRRLAAVAREAAEEIRGLAHAAHHLMTLNGVVAFYASAPSARDPHAARVLAHVRKELGRSLFAPLALMHAWRLAKRVTYPVGRLAYGGGGK